MVVTATTRSTGGAGIDTLTGGAGADRFVFGNIAEIGNNPLFRETITDFVSGQDKLDFSTAGYPQLAFIGAAAFSAANQLRLDAGVLYGNVNGDLAADFQIALTGVASLASGDFILPLVTVSVSGPAAGINEGNAGSTAHIFTVSLSAPAASTITANWSVSGIGANPANAADFIGNAFPSSTVTVLAGQTSATITVNVAGDVVVEQNETFQLTLSNLTGSNVTLGTANATSTIVNDDTAGQVINGNANANNLTGGGGNDTINGAAGNDTINGTGGNDIINGGAGRDSLTGGLGSDRFVYTLTSESVIGNNRDIIADFASGFDKIDVAAIDANTGISGNQTFTFIGAAAFSALGQARYAGGVLEFNNSGTNTVDMQIVLTGSPILLGTDIIL